MILWMSFGGGLGWRVGLEEVEYGRLGDLRIVMDCGSIKMRV